MRITGGNIRGRKLASFKGTGIRPTSDRAREAVFNLLGQDLDGCSVLDLFAGTGAFGLDALSRGALRAVFVDGSLEAVSLIKRNIALCGFEERSEVIRADLQVFLDPERASGLPGGFHLVFIDPPYRSGLVPAICRALAARRLLEPRARIVAETAKSEPVPEVIEGFFAARVRTYGDTKISIYSSENGQ